MKEIAKYKAIAMGIGVVLVFTLSYFLKDISSRQVEENKGLTEAKEVERVVALAPSTVEILYALELGGKVAGVSRYTTYPLEALEKPKVGGYVDVDMEALVALKPDLVILLMEQSQLEDKLKGMGIGTLKVKHMTVDGVLESVRKVAERCGVKDKGILLEQAMRQQMAEVVKVSEGKAKPKVLVSIGREVGTGKVRMLTAAGAQGIHQEMIGLAGGVNAYEGSVPFPQLNREHLIMMNPDVIIDMVPQRDLDAVGEEKLLAEWQEFGELKAVKNGQVYVLGGDQYFVPGPRLVETLKRYAEMIHGGGHE
ncbi:helical backbone metal receptor [Rubritalea squalenifaciens]|nr:helical backbone metal receptor [Rubritalea squalenifaciens]